MYVLYIGMQIHENIISDYVHGIELLSVVTIQSPIQQFVLSVVAIRGQRSPSA